MSLIFDGVSPTALLRRELVDAVGGRPDGRSASCARVTALHPGALGTADGSAFCRLGQTAVLCGVKAEVSRPTPGDGAGDRGLLVPSLELPALCHAQWRAGPPPERAQVDSARLLQTAQLAVDEQQLCISAGRAVWTLYCDLLCLSDDGNVMEAAALALSAALQNTRLPTAVWDEQLDRVVVDSAVREPLQLRAAPPVVVTVILSSAAGGDEADTPLLDPCHAEEATCTAQLLAVWAGDELCSLVKPGGRPLSQQLVDRCVQLSRSRACELHKLLQKSARS